MGSVLPAVPGGWPLAPRLRCDSPRAGMPCVGFALSFGRSPVVPPLGSGALLSGGERPGSAGGGRPPVGGTSAAGWPCWGPAAIAAVDAAVSHAAHPLSRALLEAVLADRTSDRFVCELVWPRLAYAPDAEGRWCAGPATDPAWRQAFPVEPQFIAERPASVALTRSIPKEHKQLLKEQLGFAGYRIGELYPRRTRRATAVNWLLAHLAQRGEPLPEAGPLPALLEAPADPVAGHPGDLQVR